jgi:hypothetical protein
MPVVVRTRPYDQEFYKAVGRRATGTTEARRKAEVEMEELFPEV